ncbi:anaphase-promoting complex, subunit 10-domain-containing protein [Scheffersomyces amazonensis]|uniref:anaphase-promoting complex, subunit 10-domain-containing protein n=1 Tax=Scheffersomyces amazonensis TaxID=1078765 RepID=UPI00315D60FB
MNSSGHWDHTDYSGDNRIDTAQEHDFYNSSSVNALATSSHAEIDESNNNDSDLLSADEIRTNTFNSNQIDIDEQEVVSAPSEQLNLEQAQRVYYVKGLEELESLQLLDLSPLANWKLSSYKQGFGLTQLRDDSPDTYWQSDGSNGNNATNAILNNQLCNPHSITIQFSKKVSLERISIFTNYSIDESYTPSRIKIMAGSSDGWDLGEVCTVSFTKPIGWSHIIFNGIRNDGVLKCFMVKIIILANHQDGKDSHIRAIRCFGKKKLNSINLPPTFNIERSSLSVNSDILKDLSLASAISSASGFSLNHRQLKIGSSSINHIDSSYNEEDGQMDESDADRESSKVLNNVADVIGFNSGFQSLDLTSISSIR